MAFAVAHGVADAAVRYDLESFDSAPPTPPASQPAATTPSTTLPTSVAIEQAADLLPRLISRGELDRAKAILANVDTAHLPAEPAGQQPAPASPICTVIMAAGTLGDDALAIRLVLAWADTVKGPAAHSQLSAWYTALVNACWPVLPDAAKAALIDRLNEQFIAITDRDVRRNLSVYVLQLSMATGHRLNNVEDLATSAIVGHAFNSADLMRWAMAMTPADNRPPLLAKLLAAEEPNRRLSTLMRFVGRSAAQPDDAVANVVIELAAAMPAGQAVDWSDWFITYHQPDVLRALAAASLRTADAGQPGDVAHASLRAAAAAALANAGDAGRADALAADALASLAAYVPPKPDPKRPRPTPRGPFTMQPDRPAVLRVAVAALSPKARAAILATFNPADTGGTQAQIAWRTALRSTLLESLGRRDEALRVLRAGLQQNSSDLTLLSLYRTRLRDDERLAELASLTQRSGGLSPTANTLRPDVSRALRGLFRWRETPDIDQNPDPTVDWMTPLAAGDRAKLAEVFRGVLQQVRTTWPAQYFEISPGGLAGTPPTPRGVPPAFLNGLADWPGALDNAIETLHVNDLGGVSADWLAVLLARVAVDRPDVRDRLFERLDRSAAAGTLSNAERSTIARLAGEPTITLRPAWIDALRTAASVNPTGIDLARFARAEADRNPSAIANKWAAVTATNVTMGWLAPKGVASPISFGAQELPPVPPLVTLADQDPAAATQQFQQLQSTDRILPRAIELRLVGARLLAINGDTDAFRQDLQSALRDWAWQQAAGSLATGQSAADDRLPDIGLAIPALVDPQRRVAVGEVVRSCLAELNARWPDQTDVCRLIARAGDTFARNGDRTSAEEMLKLAIAADQAAGMGEHRLWVADLAERLGDDARSIVIQRELLEQRCLPALRIAPLLKRLAESGRTEDVKRLADDAAAYCAEPRLKAFVAGNQ